MKWITLPDWEQIGHSSTGKYVVILLRLSSVNNTEKKKQTAVPDRYHMRKDVSTIGLHVHALSYLCAFVCL